MLLNLALAALFLPSTSPPQLGTQGLIPKPITSQVKNAGTYHLATGTWTRSSGVAALAGPEVIYDNTCQSGYYFGGTSGFDIGDSGRVPSTSSPSSTDSVTGLYDLYEVNAFEIGYCSSHPVPIDVNISFRDCYAVCGPGGMTGGPATAAFNLVNIPAGLPGGYQGCWIMNIDLSNTTMSFNLGGDCDGVYDGVPQDDGFGWVWETVTSQAYETGPFISGDPLGLFAGTGQACGAYGAGTTFPTAAAGPGTGLGTIDRIDVSYGCTWFGGYSATNPFTPFSSLYLKLEGDQAVECTNSGSAYCFGDGSGSACPCSNLGGAGEGCANSTGGGAVLSATGCATISVDTLQFGVNGVNGSKPGLLLRGNSQVALGNGSPIGDGLICANGSSQRSHVQITAGGSATFTNWSGLGFGSVAILGAPTNFQYWYRDSSSAACGTGFNFSNAWTVTYTP